MTGPFFKRAKIKGGRGATQAPSQTFALFGRSVPLAYRMADSSPRADGRAADQLRPIRFQNHIAPHATGSTLVEWGNTRVICGVMVEEIVPRWMKEQKVIGGWLTAEYSMLPYSTLERKPRDVTKGKLDGRASEIQRLIGRSMRAAIDLQK